MLTKQYYSIILIANSTPISLYKKIDENLWLNVVIVMKNWNICRLIADIAEKNTVKNIEFLKITNAHLNL